MNFTYGHGGILNESRALVTNSSLIVDNFLFSFGLTAGQSPSITNFAIPAILAIFLTTFHDSFPCRALPLEGSPQRSLRSDC
jgi:hypothetical protein